MVESARVLALILSCSSHPDDGLIRALVSVQSGGNALSVGDLRTLRSIDDLTNADAALAAVARIRQHGGRPAVGLLGIPTSWGALYGVSDRDLFDGCTNLQVGSAVLTDYARSCRRRLHSSSPTASSVRSCVLGRFAKALGFHAIPINVLAIIPPSTDVPEALGGFAAAPEAFTSPMTREVGHRGLLQSPGPTVSAGSIAELFGEPEPRPTRSSTAASGPPPSAARTQTAATPRAR